MGLLHILPRLLGLALMLATLFAAPAYAHGNHGEAFDPTCHAVSDVDRGPQDMLVSSRWNCTNDGWRADALVTWLRFDADTWADSSTPAHFVTRIARFRSIAFTAVDRDGTQRSLQFAERDGQPIGAGPVFQLPLPEITDQTTTLLVRVEGPHSIKMLTEARISRNPEAGQWSHFDLALMAFILGLMVLPLVFDISFMVQQRNRVVLAHSGMVAGMIAYILFAGGLISELVILPLPALAIAGPLLWSFACAMAALFFVFFSERGAQSPPMRRATLAAAVWTMVGPGFFALQLPFTQPIDDRGFYLSFLPVILVICIAVAEAVMRGSRSARFMAVAWAPLVIASIERLLRGLGAYTGPPEADQMLFAAVGFNVMVLSMAIGDRFLSLRTERDAALDQARQLEQLSTRDALTGLMNRRAIEARFGDLLEQGFDTFALLDLDRFKAVNDVHGHQVGDAALIACAAAIRSQGDRDTVAVRLGGEEFVLLLRGDRPLERAEALRQAVPIRIAADVPGLGLPVTASMGVIEMPRSISARVSFAEFYARADILLYEAKASGRNRMAYEKLTLFSEAQHRSARDQEQTA